MTEPNESSSPKLPRRHRWWLWLVASPLLLFVILAVLLYFPPVQRFAVNRVTKAASESTGLSISVGRIALSFPLDLVVKDVQAVSPETNDTLLDLKRVDVSVQMLPLLRQKVEIDGVSLEGGRVDTRDFIEGMRLKGHLGRLFLESHGVVFDPELAVINKFSVQDSDLSLTLDASEESEANDSDTVYWKIDLRKIDFENVRFALNIPQDTLSLSLSLPKTTLTDGYIDLHQSAYSVKSFLLENGELTFNSGLCPKDSVPVSFNPSHLTLGSIDVEVRDVYYCNRDIRAEIVRLDGRERSGLELVTTAGSIVADSASIRIPSFKMLTADSSLDLEADIAWEVVEQKRAGQLSAHLRAELGRSDIVHLMGDMNPEFVKTYPSHPLVVRADAEGTLSHIRLRELFAELPGAFVLEAGGNLTNLTDSLTRGGEINLLAEANDMNFLNPLTDGAFALPQGTRLEGHFGMKGNQMQTELLLNRQDSVADARFYAAYHLGSEAYEADVVIHDLDMHRFLPKDSLFNLSAFLKVQGEKLDLFDAKAYFGVEGKVDKMHYTRYRLSGYDLMARLENHQLEAALTARNSAMDLRAHLDGKLKTNDVAARLQMDVAKLDWKIMKLAEVDFTSSHHFEVSFVSDLLKKYVVDASMTDTSVKIPKRTFKTKDLYLGFATSADSTRAYMQAGDLDMDFRAKGYAETLLGQVEKFTQRMDEQWKTKTVVQEELKSLLPSLCLKVQSGKENPICNYLDMMQGLSFDKLYLDIDTSPQEGLNGEAYIYQMCTDSLTLDTLLLDLKHGTDGLDFLADVISTAKPHQEAFEVSLDGNIGNGHAQLLMQYLNARKEKGLYLGMNAELRRRGIRMSFFPEHPTLVYRPFTINEDNRIFLTDRGRIFADVSLYDNRGTGLNFYTNREDTLAAQDMTLELARINLREFKRIVPYMPDMEGWLGAEVHYIDSQGNTMLSADLRMDDFKYEGSSLGDWEMNGVYLPGSEDNHCLDGFIRHNEKEITHFGGVYHSDDRGSGHLVGELDLQHFPLRVVNPFIPDGMVAFTGDVDGTLTMDGTLSHPVLNGGLTMDSVSMALPELSVLFRFDDKPVRMVDSRLTFDKYNIYTKGKNPFTINGTVDFSDMEKMLVDLRMKASDYELMNAPKNRKATTYGKIYVDVDGTLKGPVDELKMRGNMNVLGKTDFTYVLKDSPLMVSDRLGDMVTFVNFNDTVSVEEETRKVALTGMDIAMTVHIDQAVQAHVDLTADGSNYMQVEGGGDLAFQYTPQGEMLLNGRYLLMSGELKYEIPVIPLKTFDIRRGSYMDWTGNPMNPTLNIIATERIRATVGSEGETPRMVGFDVGIALSQRLENLGLAFTLEAPEDASVQEQLNAMSAEERGKLAITMLVTGMYMAEGNSTGGFNMNNALNSFLQNQISDIAGKTVDLSLGMETVDDAEGSRRTDYNFQFAKRFWNNRFRIVIGGTVSTGSAARQDETFIDNVSIEYRLDNSGTRYVKLFHDKNYESVLEGEVIETGIGVVLRKKVTKLGELFIFKKKKEDNNEE